MSNAHPQVTGNWSSADSSRNHLEMAGTSEKGMYALRSSHDSGETIFATQDQLKSLAKAVEAGRIPQ